MSTTSQPLKVTKRIEELANDLLSVGDSHQIIIFDGPDGSGKTTIAKTLGWVLNIPYYKNTPHIGAFRRKDEDWFKNTMKYSDPILFQMLSTTRYSLIFDRSYPSEAVYPPIFRGYDVNWEDVMAVDAVAARCEVKIIIPNRSSYAGRRDVRDEVIDDEKLSRIHEGYRSFFTQTKCKALWLNVDDENIKRQIAEILWFLKNGYPKPIGNSKGDKQ